MSSLRTIQAARGLLDVKTQCVLNDSVPLFLQSVLTAPTQNVISNIALQDSGLFVELSSDIAAQPQGSLWAVASTVFVVTNGTAGLNLGLTASDGLQVVSSNLVYTFSAAASSATVVAAVGAPAGSGSVNVIAATIFGTVNVAGYGRLKVQFAQAFSTAINTSLSLGSYIEAYTILP